MPNSQTSMLVAKALLQMGAVGFKPREPVTFKSGILSPVYVDNRRLIFHPAQWRVVVEGFESLIAAESLAFDIVAGVAVGGIPHSSALAYMLQKPSVFIRKEAKGHGTMQFVEGGDVTGQRALLVEDLVTTGGSSLGAVERLREAGAQVDDMLAIVSYGFREALENFAGEHIRLHTLTDFSTILAAAQDMGQFDSEESSIVKDWLDDPHGWAERHGLA